MNCVIWIFLCFSSSKLIIYFMPNQLLCILQKKTHESINNRLALVMKSGKYTLGYKTVLKSLRNSKGISCFCVIFSDLIPGYVLSQGLFVSCPIRARIINLWYVLKWFGHTAALCKQVLFSLFLCVIHLSGVWDSKFYFRPFSSCFPWFHLRQGYVFLWKKLSLSFIFLLKQRTGAFTHSYSNICLGNYSFSTRNSFSFNLTTEPSNLSLAPRLKYKFPFFLRV